MLLLLLPFCLTCFVIVLQIHRWVLWKVKRSSHHYFALWWPAHQKSIAIFCPFWSARMLSAPPGKNKEKRESVCLREREFSMLDIRSDVNPRWSRSTSLWSVEMSTRSWCTEGGVKGQIYTLTMSADFEMSCLCARAILSYAYECTAVFVVILHPGRRELSQFIF